MDNTELITNIYKEYFDTICKYICGRVKSHELAADLTQDVFVRLLTHADMLRKETIKNFVFTIARNIIVDYSRRNINHVEMLSYEYDMVDSTSHAADAIAIANDLRRVETKLIKTLPPTRRKIYCMYSHDGISPREISKTLGMDRHAVYCQLFWSKKTMRDYFSKVCI